MDFIYGASIINGNAELVKVETLLGRGLNRTIVVGMVDNVTREARDRLPSALASQGFKFPKGKILFNLAPAELRKGGMPQDLALAISLIISSEQTECPKGKWLCLGELGLNGEIRPPARGTLLAAMAAAEDFRGIITAPESAPEAALAPGIKAYPASDLASAIRIIENPLTSEWISSQSDFLTTNNSDILHEDDRGNNCSVWTTSFVIARSSWHWKKSIGQKSSWPIAVIAS